jgi:prepilin-type N-terminal cleavage/methylation domain-containing protein
MAENLMRYRTGTSSFSGQRGFSMIEMLMTTFILAIGLLGLCMLQTMSLRAGRGSTSLSTAVKVAEGVMDEVEQQGRLSWLNIASTGYTGLSVPTGSVNYIAIPANSQSAPLYFDTQGIQVTSQSLITVIIYHPDEVGTNGGAGFLGDYNVVATFSDTVNGSGTPVQRTVSITRRIAHG